MEKRLFWKVILIGFLVSLQAPAFVRPDSGKFKREQSLTEEVVYKGRSVHQKDAIALSTFQTLRYSSKNPKIQRSGCTATLISPRVLLTAAHCFEDDPVFDKMAIRYFSREDNRYIYIDVAAVKAHENYFVKLTSTEYKVSADIGLIFLERNIPGGVPVRLAGPETQLQKNQKLLLAGFGENGSGSSEIFKPLLSTETYGELSKSKYVVDERVLEIRSPHSVCSGDSGGPTFTKNKTGELMIIGVHSLSTNIACEAPRGFFGEKFLSTDIYVPDYAEWILQESK